MEFNGNQSDESARTVITERSHEFKNLISYFEGLSTISKMSINTISKNSIDTITKMPVPSVTKKEEHNKIEHKPVLIKKQKKVSFDLTKNTTFFYESEDSIERRMEIKRPLKENTKTIKNTIIMPMQFDIHHEQETRMFDYKEIRHFWENVFK